MINRNRVHLCLCATVALSSTLLAAEQVPAQQAKKIAEAAPAKAQVVPKKPRRVLIWITPPHLMEKDPHKGYCIPYGAVAFETLGRKSGAFEPVVSDDLTAYLPDRIRQFDAIVMNNSSGPWITPTDAGMATIYPTIHPPLFFCSLSVLTPHQLQPQSPPDNPH